MSSAFWQSLIVAVAIGGATVYLVRALLKRRKAASHCANCPAMKLSRRH